MNIKNLEAANYYRILVGDGAVVSNPATRLSPAFRHALRKNIRALEEIYKTYSEEQLEIGRGYVERGEADKDDRGDITPHPEHAAEFTKELTDLALLDNDVQMEMFRREDTDKVEENEMSLAEEDVIELFTQQEKLEETSPAKTT